MEIRKLHDYGSGAVQSAAEAHNAEPSDSVGHIPAKVGDACNPLSVPASLELRKGVMEALDNLIERINQWT